MGIRNLFIFPERNPGQEAVKRAGELRLPNLTVLCHEQDRETVASLSGNILTYPGGNLAPCRTDLPDIARSLPAGADVHMPEPFPFALTALRLLGIRSVRGMDGKTIDIAPIPDTDTIGSLLLKTNGGIGNVVLTTFLLSASLDQGWTTYFCPTSDSNGLPLTDLFEGTGQNGLHLIRPDELSSISPDISLNIEDHANRKPDDFFHGLYRVGIPGHDPTFAAQFFENVTGIRPDISRTFVGGDPGGVEAALKNRIVVSPGSKVGWDPKRWPHMNALLEELDNPIVLCQQPDLDAYRDIDFLAPIETPKAEYVTDMSLKQVAGLLHSAKAVIANDCGLAHVAAATGSPTLVFFGPSSELKNSHPRDNVRHLTCDMECRPCQNCDSGPGRLAPNDYHCEHDYTCLADIEPAQVLRALDNLLDPQDM